jgi:hypothetical protein
MTSKLNKFTKKEIIEIINIYYIKNNINIEINLNKLSKTKLIDIINNENIPIINNNDLINETIETEKFNDYIEIIYYNFLKYKNIHYSIISYIKENYNSLSSTDLHNIIIKNNLIIDDINIVKNTNKMIVDISNIINSFSNQTNSKIILENKTLPDIIHFLNNIYI